MAEGSGAGRGKGVVRGEWGLDGKGEGAGMTKRRDQEPEEGLPCLQKCPSQ